MGARGQWCAGVVLALTVSTVAQARNRPTEEFWAETPLVRRPRTRAPDVAGLVRRSRAAVVSITTLSVTHGSAGDKAALGGKPTETREKGMGSGFVVHPDGLVLTNHHVIAGAREVRVTLDDGATEQTLPAEVVGVDKASDTALLQIHAGRPLTALPLGDSDRIRVGDWVVAEGNPFGLSHSVTVGIISYVGRSDVAPEGHEGFRDYLQTDASINPGSSGGPLLDLHGRVVGMANAVNPVGQGIAFALPINMVKRVLPQLLAYGACRKAHLGVVVADETLERGARVAGVEPAGPAAVAGLQAGDVVLRFDHQPVRHAQHLRWLALNAPLDRPVPLEVLRGQARLRLLARLRQAPAEAGAEPVETLGARVTLVDVPSARALGLALPNGARVVALVEGPAQQAGLHVGDVITRVGPAEVDSPDELMLALGQQAGAVQLTVRRGRQELQLPLARRAGERFPFPNSVA